MFVYKYAQKKETYQYELEDILKDYNEIQKDIDKDPMLRKSFAMGSLGNESDSEVSTG